MQVAVYGTLKRGYENHETYLPGYEPITTVDVEMPFVMYATKEYPMLVPSPELHRIRVEVYEVSDAKMLELDALEAPYNYDRRIVPIPGVGDEVSLYVHPDPAPERFDRVSSGNWDRDDF